MQFDVLLCTVVNENVKMQFGPRMHATMKLETDNRFATLIICNSIQHYSIHYAISVMIEKTFMNTNQKYHLNIQSKTVTQITAPKMHVNS